MLKKTITYTDYDGNQRTEDCYFNLNESELVELGNSTQEGFVETITNIINANDKPAIMGYFKKLLLLSYGQKSSDGRRFIKSEKISEEFSQTEAYNKLFMELVTDENAAPAFINAVIPNIKIPASAAESVTATD
jgi:hypothetical protein